MSIRINKVLGYGLVDLDVERNGELSDDSRFNKTTCLDEDTYDGNHTENFVKFLKEKYTNERTPSILHWVEREKININWIHNTIIHESEFGMPDVVLFVPPMVNEDWRQHDNTISYYEETIQHEQQSHVQLLSRPIYPYESYVDLRNSPPTRLNLTQFSDVNLIKDKEFGTKHPQAAHKLVQNMGFDNRTELNENIVPIVPDALVDLLEFLNIFKDNNTIYQLKPMIYTYWC